MKRKPTVVGFSGEEGSMLNLVFIKTRNAPIPTMKIRQIEYFKLNSVENKMQLEFVSSSHK